VKITAARLNFADALTKERFRQGLVDFFSRLLCTSQMRMSQQLERFVGLARSPQPWDVGNRVLYKLCKQSPDHSDENAVLAKIWLIGRAYAAAIERRRNKATDNESFYLRTVVPKIVNSDIDDWVAETRAKPRCFSTMVATHGRVTSLFQRISGLEKRSLASKYLHFHLPTIFFIYDARAIEGIRLIKLPKVKKRSLYPKQTDNEYRKFAEKCAALQSLVRQHLGVSLAPRQLDNLLLNAAAAKSSPPGQGRRRRHVSVSRMG
jgi:hypothetical protein